MDGGAGSVDSGELGLVSVHLEDLLAYSNGGVVVGGGRLVERGVEA